MTRQRNSIYDVVYENAVGKFVFSQESKVLMQNFEGFSGQSINITTASNIGQYGGSLASQTIDARALTLAGLIYADEDEVKQKLINVFVPFEEGVLTVNGKYKITCYVKSSPDISISRKGANFTMTLYCPYPLFTSLKSSSYVLNKLDSQFFFPWNIAETYRFASKQEGFNNIFAIGNAGHFPAPFTITITAKGSVQNPRYELIKDTTVTSIELLRTLTMDEVVTIDTGDSSGVRAYSSLGGDITGQIAFDSDFFTIPIGSSQLIAKAENDEESANMETELVFYPTYNGVVV